MVMPGDYEEVDIVWPNTSDISLKGAFGGVTISQATDAATAVITMAPTRTASWYASISNLTIKSDFSTGTKGKCLNIANANVTAGNKMGITLDNVNLSTKAATDFSLVSTGTVAGSIRVYAKGNYPTWEGIVTWTSFNTGDRLRVYNHRIIGVPTAAAAIVSEVTFIGCAVPIVTPHANTLYTNIGRWVESDADPDVYSDYSRFLRDVEVEASTSEAVLASDTGKVFSTTASAGATTYTLPTASAGLSYTFVDVSATSGDDLHIQAATGDTINGGTVAKIYQCVTDEVPVSVTLVAIDATQWVVVSEIGTWANNNS